MSKSVLITGASTGIGFATAKDLASQGWRVYAGVRSEADRENLAQAHDSILPIILDVTQSESIQQAHQEIAADLHDPLHALINNAGIAGASPIELQSLEDWQKLFAVNLFGAVEVTKTFLPLLRQSKGRIVNMSSVSGLMTSPYLTCYSASKFALEAFSDGLRRECAHFGIQVSVIEPGPIKTPIWNKSFGQSAQSLAACPEELQNLYKKGLESFTKSLDTVVQEALPVEDVCKAVAHALMNKKPKTRYIVSKKGFVYNVLRALPDRIVDKYLFNIK
ncbi:MAG: SDR family oxidoreductase [Bdellovibrionales bacterium]|nr:SDR family oxidoreductase [Bdellovibrionales bacterium]